MICYSTVVCDQNSVSVSGLNFGIGIGAITFSAETEIALYCINSTNFDFCLMADWKI